MAIGRVKQLRLGRYRFHCKISTPVLLPPYAASTLRGVFGRSLRDLVCLTRASVCDGCRFLETCPYPMIFENQIVRNKSRKINTRMPSLANYAIETSFIPSNYTETSILYRTGEHFSFDMVLMTPEVLSQLSLIIAAWKQAIARGMGRGNGTATLGSVEHLQTERGSNSTVYDENHPRIRPHKAEVTVPQFTVSADVKLIFQTPLRIRQKGRLIKSQELTAGLFLRQLIRRVSLHICAQRNNAYTLEDIHQLNFMADQVASGDCKLEWFDWDRFSSRQHRRMTLGGLLGYLNLKNVPPDLLPFIYLGQWLHVGKESSFGFGKYKWISPLTVLK